MFTSKNLFFFLFVRLSLNLKHDKKGLKGMDYKHGNSKILWFLTYYISVVIITQIAKGVEIYQYVNLSHFIFIVIY